MQRRRHSWPQLLFYQVLAYVDVARELNNRHIPAPNVGKKPKKAKNRSTTKEGIECGWTGAMISRIIGHIGDLPADIYTAKCDAYLYFTVYSTAAVMLLNSAGMVAQYQRSRCEILSGILISISDCFSCQMCYNVC